MKALADLIALEVAYAVGFQVRRYMTRREWCHAHAAIVLAIARGDVGGRIV